MCAKWLLKNLFYSFYMVFKVIRFCYLNNSEQFTGEATRPCNWYAIKNKLNRLMMLIIGLEYNVFSVVNLIIMFPWLGGS